MAKQVEIFDIFHKPEYLLYAEVFPEAESDEIEYKSARNGFPTDFWNTYVKGNGQFYLNSDFRKLSYVGDVDSSNVDSEGSTTKTFKKKIPIHTLKREVCKNEYISAEEIAIRVHRSEKHLKKQDNSINGRRWTFNKTASAKKIILTKNIYRSNEITI